MENKAVRVRMAPSPTGNLHIGTAYTTLFNYLFAGRNKGVFILRLEDTDIERNKPEYEKNILEGLKWLGLNWNEGPFYQSKRLKNYEEARDKLLKEGKAYHCFCTVEELDQERKDQQIKKTPQIYSGKCRNLTPEQIEEKLNAKSSYVIRFKMPENRGEISWDDLIHGRTGTEANLIGDFVIFRSSGFPLYNFAVVVDDIDMKITHVLRGDDHLSNTPKQIVLFEALGAALPEFAHWPMILNPNRIGKLSKRENAAAVSDFRDEGYLPEALVNYMALIGWTMPGDIEIMTLPEMEASFDLKKMRKSGAAFDLAKLDWINGEYIRAISDEELTKRLEDFLPDHPSKDKIKVIVPLVKERIKKLSDFTPLTDFLFEKPDYDKSVFEKISGGRADEVIQGKIAKIYQKMAGLKKPWIKEDFEKEFRKAAEEEDFKTGDFFQLIRAAISGQLVTPPLFESIQILGEEETMARVKYVSENFQSFENLNQELKF